MKCFVRTSCTLKHVALVRNLCTSMHVILGYNFGVRGTKGYYIIYNCLVLILSSPLLQELKANHVTLNAHVPTMIGIPPHIAHMQEINNVEDACEEIKNELKGMWEDMKRMCKRKSSHVCINTALFNKRLGDIEKRLMEKLDTLAHVQVEPLTHVVVSHNLADALEEPGFLMCHQLNYHD